MTLQDLPYSRSLLCGACYQQVTTHSFPPRCLPAHAALLAATWVRFMAKEQSCSGLPAVSGCITMWFRQCLGQLQAMSNACQLTQCIEHRSDTP